MSLRRPDGGLSPRVLSKWTMEDFPPGRLVHVDNLDSEHLASFFIPSRSVRGKVYELGFDDDSGEICCCCDAWDFAMRNARTSPYTLSKGGTPVEHFAKSHGFRWSWMITRPPSKLCRHARLAREWVLRHKLMKRYIDTEALRLDQLDYLYKQELDARVKRKTA